MKTDLHNNQKGRDAATDTVNAGKSVDEIVDDLLNDGELMEQPATSEKDSSYHGSGSGGSPGTSY
jgi:hypothetical protein